MVLYWGCDNVDHVFCLPGKTAPKPPVSSSNLILKTLSPIWTWICTVREHGFNLMLTNAYTATLLLWPKAPQLYPPLFWFNQLSVGLWKIFHIWKPPLKCVRCVCVQIWLSSVVTERNSVWNSPSIDTVPRRTRTGCLGSTDLCIPRPSGEENCLAS